MSMLVRRGNWWIGVTEPRPARFHIAPKKVSVSHKALMLALESPGAHLDMMNAEWWATHYSTPFSPYTRTRMHRYGTVVVRDISVTDARDWLDQLAIEEMDWDQLAVTIVTADDGLRMTWAAPDDVTACV